MIAGISHDAMLAQALGWAAVNSGTGNLAGLSAMAARLAEAFAVLPGHVELVEPAAVTAIGADGSAVAVRRGQHLVLRVRPEANMRVLLTGHMDTVYAADHPFQACSWVDADTVNGPGTADMKAGLALMLAGLIAFERSGPHLGYDVMINSDEETGSLASAGLIAQLAAGKVAALTYEPALPSGAMAGARPGSGNYAATVRGRAAHAGRNPEDGRNAVVAAADLALRLAAARAPGLAINPARMDGGGPDNLVPDLAVLRFNIRPVSTETAAGVPAMLATMIDAVAAAHDVTITLHGGVSRPPKPITPAADALFTLVARAGADLGQAITRSDTGGVCDGNNVAAMGVPVIDTMGALGGEIHSPDEFLHVGSLGPRAALTALVLHRINQGDFAP